MRATGKWSWECVTLALVWRVQSILLRWFMQRRLKHVDKECERMHLIGRIFAESPPWKFHAFAYLSWISNIVAVVVPSFLLTIKLYELYEGISAAKWPIKSILFAAISRLFTWKTNKSVNKIKINNLLARMIYILYFWMKDCISFSYSIIAGVVVSSTFHFSRQIFYIFSLH